MVRFSTPANVLANQVGAAAASRVAAIAASYSRKNSGSPARATSRSGSTRRSSSIGLCRVKLQSGWSMARNSARALRLQLQEILAARVDRPRMRSGSGGIAAGDEVIGPANYLGATVSAAA